MMSGRDLLRSGVAMHVSLQARAERRFQGDAVRDDLRRAGFSTEMILANVRGLRKVVEGMAWDPPSSEWSGYAEDCQHVAAHRSTKERFLRAAIERVGPERVLDLGANDGFFSRAAAESCEVVVAADADELVLDRLYESAGAAGSIVVQPLAGRSVQPIATDGMERAGAVGACRAGTTRPGGRLCGDPSPGGGEERPAGGSGRVAGRLGCPVVLRWVGPEDPMAQAARRQQAARRDPPRLPRGGLRPSSTSSSWCSVKSRSRGGRGRCFCSPRNERRHRGHRRGPRSDRVSLVDLALSALAVTAIAVAQPILDLLGRTPEFFTARAAPTVDVVLLGVALGLGLPLLIAGIVLLADVISHRAGVIVHAAVLVTTGHFSPFRY